MERFKTQISLGPADLGPLMDLVDYPVAGVPESALIALTHLPLTPRAWQHICPKVNILLDEVEAPEAETVRPVKLDTEIVLRGAARVPDPDVRERVRMIAASGDVNIRRAAARALAGVGDPAAVPQLLDDLKGTEDWIQSAAIQDLVFVDTPTLNWAARRSLARASQLAPNPLTKLNAAVLLARSGRPGKLTWLLKALRRDASSIFPGASPDLSILRELELPEKVRKGLLRFTQEVDRHDLAQEIAEALLAVRSNKGEPSDRGLSDGGWDEATDIDQPDAGEMAEAKKLANTYLHGKPDADWVQRLRGDIDILSSAPVGTAEELVAEIYQRIAAAAAAGPGNHIEAGNAALELVNGMKCDIQLNIGAFFPTYLKLKQFSPQVADQLAWTVSRASTPKLLADLGAALPATLVGDRAELANLFESVVLHVSASDPPFYGAGSESMPKPRAVKLLGRGSGVEPPDQDQRLVIMGRQGDPPQRRVRVGVVTIDPPECSTNLDVLPNTEPLTAGGAYFLRIDISAEAGGTNVVNADPIPDQILKRIPQGERLDVVVSSEDFEIPASGKYCGRQTISLLPDSASTFAYVRLTAPVQSALARARVCIFFRNTLLQWLETTASVVPNAEPAERPAEMAGNETRILYTISPHVTDFEDYESVAVNIVVDSVRGNVEVKDDEQPPSPFGNISESIKLFRDMMASISTDADSAYRFQPNNQGSSQELPGQLMRMADQGRSLFDVMFTEPTQSYLRGKLAKPGVIEIARRTSQDSIPWSAIYDLPLTEAKIADLEGVQRETCMLWRDDAHKLPVLNQDGQSELVPDAERCASRLDCPLRPLPEESTEEHEARTSRHVCVYGFWGFKHRMQMPAGMYEENPKEESIQQPSREANPLRQAIRFQGHPRVSVIGNPEIAFYPAPHRDRIKALGTGRWQPDIHAADSFQEIKKELQEPDSHVIYFYCHGRTDGSYPMLIVGGGPSFDLSTSTISSWCKRWAHGPLVIVNGCETISYSPESLTNLAIWWRARNASGVIGTEIQVFPELAREFGEQFLARFLAGQPVGEVMLRLRLGLLERLNPLGLVYTNHTLAGLRLSDK